MSFPHLRVRSTYSLLKGASTIDVIVKEAVKYNIPAMALTDHDNLFGALEFSKQCMKKGIQPIQGMRVRVLNDNGKGGYLTLLATDAEGFSNICAMVKKVGVPASGSIERKVAGDVERLPRESLEAFGAGVICLWGGGEDGSMWNLPATDISQEYKFLKGIFQDRLYVEICRPLGSEQALNVKEEAQIDIAYLHDIPLVGTIDVWYAKPEHHRAWVLLRAMSAEPRQEILFTDDGMMDAGEPVYCLCSAEEAMDIFSDIPEAYVNAFQVSKRCSFAVQGRAPMLPPFSCGNGRTETEELRSQSQIGLQARLDKKRIPINGRKIYEDRLEFELSVIVRMGFPGYFLIVSDFIRWAREHDIPVGPGRGSGAGSVVAWSLRITDINPLEFGLLFERFLNPDRVSMPDFDVDFCEDRRDEVISYVRQKYGENNVSYIATFGMLKGKSALRDTHRVVRHDKLGACSLMKIGYVTKLIPKKVDAADPMSLQEAYDNAPEFREAVSPSNPTVNMVYELAKEVEGLMKSRGLHAAGVVISDRSLETLIPVLTDEKTGATVTGYSLKGVEEAGLVKFDFLGLTTLSIMKEACNNIKFTHGFDLDLEEIPRDDPSVMAGLSKGDAIGVFQFETGGMRGVMKQIKPNRLEDLIAIVSLFRPGPMQYIDTYADRKAGAAFEYPGGEERTKQFLEETHGIMVYQEQVMQVAQACAGYSLGEADLLRRAMGKKQKSEMEKQKKTFIEGCVAGYVNIILEDDSIWRIHSKLHLRTAEDTSKMTVQDMMDKNMMPHREDFTIYAKSVGSNNPDQDAISAPTVLKIVSLTSQKDGMTREGAEKLFSDIETFANYGFNKSHAAAYAWLGYQTAWIRKMFPAEFYASLMTYCKKPEKRGMVMDDMKFHDVQMLPPDINRSCTRFKPEMDGNELCVRYGFCGIKGLPDNMDWIDRERKERGEFCSLKDFYTRNRKRLKKNHMQVLAAMGAFNSLIPVRSQAADILQKLEGMDTKTEDLFGGSDIKSDIAEWPDIPEREFKSAGFYISGHPLDPFLERLSNSPVRTKNWWLSRMREAGQEKAKGRLLCVLVRDVVVKQSKNGSMFLQVRVSDQEDTFQMNCFMSGDNDDDASEGMRNLRQVLTTAKRDNIPVIIDCDLSMSGDGEQLWVNGNDAMLYKDYVKELDSTNDLITIRLSLPEGQNTEAYLEKMITNAEKKFLPTRQDENPSKTVSIDIVCEGIRKRIAGRYIYIELRTHMQASIPGILKMNYIAGGLLTAEK